MGSCSPVLVGQVKGVDHDPAFKSLLAPKLWTLYILTCPCNDFD